MILSKSYSLEDFTRSATAKRLKIDNTPDAKVLERLKVLAGVLEYLQGTLGLTLTISSGYRCPKLNMAIGGVETSGHSKGYACDIQCPTEYPEDLAHKIKALGIKVDQCIIESAGSSKWLHLSVDPRFRGLYFRIEK